MKRLGTLALTAATAALMAGTSAQAQSSALGNGFYVDGYVEFGYFDDNSVSDT